MSLKRKNKKVPVFAIAGGLFLLALIYFFSRIPSPNEKPPTETSGSQKSLKEAKDFSEGAQPPSFAAPSKGNSAPPPLQKFFENKKDGETLQNPFGELVSGLRSCPNGKAQGTLSNGFNQITKIGNDFFSLPDLIAKGKIRDVPSSCNDPVVDCGTYKHGDTFWSAWANILEVKRKCIDGNYEKVITRYEAKRVCLNGRIYQTVETRPTKLQQYAYKCPEKIELVDGKKPLKMPDHPPAVPIQANPSKTR